MAKPTEEMISQLGSIPTNAEAPAAQAPPQDPRERTMQALHGIDAHLMSDSVQEHLKPEEVTRLRELHKSKPDEAYAQAMALGTPRLVQKLVPPMEPEAWQGLRQFAGDSAVKRAGPGSIKSPADEAALREIGMKSFDDTLGKHKKYVVLQNKATPQPVPQEPRLEDAIPLVAPKKLAAPAGAPGSQFARSLIDMVRGASQVGAQQQKTGRNIKDDLFAKILAGAPMPRGGK